MVIAVAAIVLIFLNSCASAVQPLPEPTHFIVTPASTPTHSMGSVSRPHMASATPSLQPLPVIPDVSTPTPVHGEPMIYIIQFQSKLNMAQRDLFLAELAQKLGRPIPVIYHYEVAYHGVAVELTAAEAVMVASMHHVSRVQLDTPRYAQPHRPNLIEVE